MQFEYTIEPHGQRYLLKIANVGEKIISTVADVQDQAKKYIEACRNIPYDQIKVVFVSSINDSIISKNIPTPYNKKIKG